MSFGENLQFLRKKNNITQEQLAERLNVSRQSVSKWESENSYPEMEKIMQLCSMFECKMDTLLRGSMEETVTEDTAEYDHHMNTFSISIAVGVALIILGIGVNALLESMGVLERIYDATFLCFVAVAICTFVISGIKHNIFCNNYPKIKQFYRPEQLKIFDRKFPILVGVGVTLIIIGFIFVTAMEGIPAPFGLTEEFYTSIFMFILAIAVSILTYTGIQKLKYDVKTYNQENEREKSGKMTKTGKWCSVIMLIATILFICSIGILLMEQPGNWNSWQGSIMVYSWIVFPIGGLVCGIVSILFAKEDKEENEVEDQE